MPDMPMPPMPTKWIGPIWFGSFMLSNPQRGRLPLKRPEQSSTA
jgi:hypothetical protein